MTFIDRFYDFLNSLPDSLIYFFLCLSAVIENIFPPLPGDTVTAFGAFLVGTGRLHLVGVFFATTVGSIFGFMLIFLIGRILGRRFFIERDFWLFKAKDIIRAEHWYRKYGYFLVTINRFFPGIRSVISLACGITQLNTVKVCLYASISACVWNVIWMGLGYTMGANWETAKFKLTHMMARYNYAVLGVLLLLALAFITKKVFFNRKK